MIGGGVIGIASAYYLAKEGWKVTILERGRTGVACSRGNCGIIGLSHFMPLNTPGAVTSTLKAMLRPDSPFSIRPRFDPRLWFWLSNFALRCNQKQMLASARVRAALLESTEIAYRELLENEPIDCELGREGSLFVFKSPGPFEQYAKTDAWIRREFDFPADRIEGDDLQAFEPSLKEGLAGAWHYPQDFHVRPDRLVASWRKVAEGLGVEIRENTEVVRIDADPYDSRRATRVITEREEITADCVVVAMGAMTPIMNEHLGCRLPVQPGKGYSITQSRPSISPRMPLLFKEHKVVATPFDSGYRLGSTMEFAGYDTRFRQKRFDLLGNAAELYLHEPNGPQTEEMWFGWRSMTYDGIPFIDRSPRFANVLVATGHNMIGITLAPATGKLIAELAGDRKPHIDLHPLRIGR
ncbi:D-amino acid dehydrogenase small subunit [Rosistilla carotiformis]|uniref:D-amino acid dehydrogenase small subunit n=1 Tax=Rosistilla carotiformis TaxID=2528017 RepID=A0A518JSD6_9BACT|nr:D-amino acid dehydrogenase small subunit [Rosistilla carotiformis]